MSQVQAGAYVSLLTPGGTKNSDCHPRRTTTYILHVVYITPHTHNRHVKSIGEQETKKENKIKEKKEKRRKTKQNEKGKRIEEEKDEKSKKRQDRKARKE